ncbi:hypothetical protein FHG87_017871 [Trinorchestia longiramus]|nr:hypothetical protein FHG87_017871 [Trinorchestia longiramus]
MGPKKDSDKGKAKRKTVRTTIELMKKIIAKYESGTSVTAAVIPAGTCTTEENAVMEDILSMGRSMGIEVNREDIDELVEGHSSELTTEEFLYLQQQQQQDLVQEQEDIYVFIVV